MKYAICLCISLAIGITAAGSEIETADRTLAVSGPVSLDVRSDPGGIEIKAGNDNSSVRVRAVIKPLLGHFDIGLAATNMEQLKRNPPIEQTGNQIRIGYAKPELLRGVSIHYELEVPRATTVRALTSSGGIKVEGVAGEVIASTRSGRVFVREIHGHVSARTQSGAMQILSVDGPLEVETISGGTEVSGIAGKVRSTTHSGSITVEHSKGDVSATNVSGSIDAFQINGAVEAHTRSGAIRISQIAAAPIRAESHSGAISVDLAHGQGYWIDAQSHSGKVLGPRNDSSDKMAKIHQLKQQIGNGGPLVDLDTNSAAIEVN